MKYDEIASQIVGWGGVHDLEESGLIIVRQKDYDEMKEILEKIKNMYLNDSSEHLTILRRVFRMAVKTLESIEGELE